jgi:hypothetical protein
LMKPSVLTAVLVLMNVSQKLCPWTNCTFV